MSTEPSAFLQHMLVVGVKARPEKAADRASRLEIADRDGSVLLSWDIGRR